MRPAHVLHRTDDVVAAPVAHLEASRVAAEFEVHEVHHAGRFRIGEHCLRLTGPQSERLVTEHGALRRQGQANVTGVQKWRRVHRHEVETGAAAQLVDRGVVTRGDDVDDFASLRCGERRRDDTRTEPGADHADAHAGGHSPSAASGSGSVASTPRWKRARKKWPSGPIANANSTVPPPTLPPTAPPP